MQTTGISINAMRPRTMKLMNSVPAGVAGTVVEICLVNGAFVEQDAVLMRVVS